MNVRNLPPEKPSIMNRLVSSLTLEEIDSLRPIVEKYEEDMAAWRTRQLAKSRMSLDTIRALVEHDMYVEGHPWTDNVWKWTINNIAWMGLNPSRDDLMKIKETYENNLIVAKMAAGGE